ncbi:glutamate racemase [Anaeroselena agilis]|uniref:Glutamate racemase n=1 Tax=Anaeroselena agilis TaxID=3063788 RepID=A0ABU3NSZ2_9FIRM|nr:glutamate racemase [Selenomonadales bacterium 4137-cl]
MNGEAAIGVFDSGVGGLTVVKELAWLMPEEHYIYFGDTARAPYGSRPPSQILAFMRQILDFFADRQVKMAVFACNTMTALGLEAARHHYPFPLVGMNPGARVALNVTRNKHIGVIATQAAIASGKHGQALTNLDPGVTVFPQACPKFVPCIERGILDGGPLEAAAQEYLMPLREERVDTLILGCTHYPLISPLIRRVMGPEVKLVDPACETALDARRCLIKHGLLAGSGRGSVRLCFSGGLDRAELLAETVIGDRLAEFEYVDLQDYACP